MHMTSVRAGGAALAATVLWAASASAQPSPVAADMKALVDASGGGGFAAGARKLLAARGPMADDGVEMKTESYAADPAQAARIYTPQAATHGPRAPLIVYFHDGWSDGSLDDGDAASRALATRFSAVVISLDYRKAAAHPFPAQRADANFAWDWATRNAMKFRADRGKLAIVGEGEGANLALMVAVRTKVAPVSRPTAILLIDPVAKAGPSVADDIASPSREGLDLSGLAPVTIVNAGAGRGLAEGAALEAALRAARTPVERYVAPGAVEGFFGYGSLVRAAYDAQGYVYDRLRRGFDIVYPGEPGSFTKVKPLAPG